MFKKASLLAVLPVLVLTLAGCTGTSTTVITVTATPKSSAQTTSTPTPTASPLTVKQAAATFLDVICPANAAQFQVGRAASTSPMDLDAVRKAAAKASKTAAAASTTLSDKTVIWPGTSEQDRFSMAGDLDQSEAYFSRLQFVTSEDEANAEEAPTSDSASAVRQALDIDGDRILLCVGHHYEAAFPKGYPKVVNISKVPAQPRSAIEYTGAKKAVAIAPGVWSALTPGASVADVLNANTADGFCASIKAYERQYMYGVSLSGSCY